MTQTQQVANDLLDMPDLFDPDARDNEYWKKWKAAEAMASRLRAQLTNVYMVLGSLKMENERLRRGEERAA